VKLIKASWSIPVCHRPAYNTASVPEDVPSVVLKNDTPFVADEIVAAHAREKIFGNGLKVGAAVVGRGVSLPPEGLAQTPPRVQEHMITRLRNNRIFWLLYKTLPITD